MARHIVCVLLIIGILASCAPSRVVLQTSDITLLQNAEVYAGKKLLGKGDVTVRRWGIVRSTMFAARYEGQTIGETRVGRRPSVLTACGGFMFFPLVMFWWKYPKEIVVPITANATPKQGWDDGTKKSVWDISPTSVWDKQ